MSTVKNVIVKAGLVNYLRVTREAAQMWVVNTKEELRKDTKWNSPKEKLFRFSLLTYDNLIH